MASLSSDTNNKSILPLPGGAGGTFALYSLIARHAGIGTPATGGVSSHDVSLSRYTSASKVDEARPRRKTVGESVRGLPWTLCVHGLNSARSAGDT